jgi:hypothetical protein
MQRRHRRAHLRIWLLLLVLLPLGFALGLTLRQERPVEPTTYPQAAGR